MRTPPDFDPFDLLGVDASADVTTIEAAYKARIRYVHPDIAGAAGLDEAKRLNIAREWLRDPELRALLPRPTPRWGRFHRRGTEPTPRPRPSSTGPTAPPEPPPAWTRAQPTEPRPAWDYDPLEHDPLTFDYGPLTAEVRAFFEVIRGLSTDERARVTYSLGDEPPVHFGAFREAVGDRLWARSRALGDAIERVWRERDDEGAPLHFPRGRVFGNGAVVAEAYLQWRLLGEAIATHERDARSTAATADRCTWPWTASVGRDRYGGREDEMAAFLDDARGLSATAAERLARAWQRDMGSFLYGRPGEDWFPGALDTPKPDLVSARLAAVDASRIDPPEALAWEHHHAFRCGLRLTAHVLALGGVEQPGRDYLRPWRDALDSPDPSFRDRARWGMPLG